jgi:hypothetical protein
LKKIFINTAFTVTLLLLISNQLQAKSRYKYRIKEDPYWDFGMQTGLGNYIGDLVPNYFYFNQYHPYASIIARYNFDMHWSMRSAISIGVLSGDDSKTINAARNLSFKTGIQELSYCAEYNLLPYHAFRTKKIFTTYVFAGIAVFHFNPTTEYDGQKIKLQPLGTEGQGGPGYRKKYSLIQPSIPIGGGLKYRLKIGEDRFITIGGEFGIRKTFTDYLDDVSGRYIPIQTLIKNNGQMAANLSIRAEEYYHKPEGYFDANWDVTRGNRLTQDWYFWGGLTVSYVFRHNKYNFVRRR